MLKIELAPTDVDWDKLHALIVESYAYMADRIDPPSSILSMSNEDLRVKASDETLITATSSGQLVGCLFCRPDGNWLYVGKMTVAAEHQRSGVGKMMIERARLLAQELGMQGLELETRIELTENHRAFARLGFTKVADQSHPGYDRVTNIRMRAPLPWSA